MFSSITNNDNDNNQRGRTWRACLALVALSLIVGAATLSSQEVAGSPIIDKHDSHEARNSAHLAEAHKAPNSAAAKRKLVKRYVWTEEHVAIEEEAGADESGLGGLDDDDDTQAIDSKLIKSTSSFISSGADPNTAAASLAVIQLQQPVDATASSGSASLINGSLAPTVDSFGAQSVAPDVPRILKGFGLGGGMLGR